MRQLAICSALAFAAGAATAQDSDVMIALQLEPPHLDPTSAAAGAIDQVLYSNVFEGLTKFGPSGEILPSLAESWEVSDDGTVYTFHLQDGVTFHDGSEMTADDVVFTLERARGGDSTNAQKALFAGIEKVEAVDPQTVRVTLSEPDGSFLFNMAWGDAVIVAPESIDDIKQNPVGTGPFRFEDWVQGDRIDLVRYPDYWGDAPALEHATFRFISDPTAAFAAMMAEDIDAFISYPAPENLPQFEADPRFQVLTRLDRGRDDSRHQQRLAPLRRPQGARGDRARYRPSGDHRRRDVRLRHAHRLPFRAAQSRLRRSDGPVRLRS